MRVAHLQLPIYSAFHTIEDPFHRQVVAAKTTQTVSQMETAYPTRFARRDPTICCFTIPIFGLHENKASSRNMGENPSAAGNRRKYVVAHEQDPHGFELTKH